MKLLKIMWHVCALNQIFQMLDDDSGRVVSDYGLKVLSEGREAIDKAVKQSIENETTRP